MAVAAGIPHAELVVIPDASHMVFADQPDAFNDAVRRFLTSLRHPTVPSGGVERE